MVIWINKPVIAFLSTKQFCGPVCYDLICIHPNPRDAGPAVRVQVKSRLATDSDRSILVKPNTLGGFDFLIVVYLNVGYFLSMAKRHQLREGERDPEFLTLPNEIVRAHTVKTSSWGKVRFKGLDLDPYRGTRGFDLIADKLGVPYPVKAKGVA